MDTLDLDSNINLEPIEITFFEQNAIDFANFSALSWLSFLGIILTTLLIAFWIFLLIRAAFKAMKSEGEEEGLQDAYKSLQSTFAGAAIAIVFPIILTIFGIVFGLGPFWTWPTALQSCASPNYEFYFQALIDETSPDQPRELAVAEAEAICGY